MKIIGLLTLCAFLSAPAWGQSAPFCVVSQTGLQNCHYYTLDSCRQAAQRSNGACATNSGANQQQSGVLPVHTMIQQPDFAGSFQRGQAEGQRLRLERERHQAEMELLAAQTEAVKAKRQQTNDGYWVMYTCPDGNGNWQSSGVPVPGCIVEFVEAY